MSDFPLAITRLRVADLYRCLDTLDTTGVAGRYLMGREVVGVPIRRQIEDRYLAAKCPTTYLLDFAGVEDISASVAEELGPILFNGILARSRPESERYVVYANLSQDTLMGFDDVFRRTGQVALAISPDGLREQSPKDSGATVCIDLLGPPMPRPLKDVVVRCYAKGGITSSDLADGSLAAASKKLTELCERYPGIMHRVKIYGASGARSWHYAYFPLIAPCAYASGLRASEGQEEDNNTLVQASEWSHYGR